MLNQKDFDAWCNSLGLSQAARSVIERIRSSEPSRKVQSRVGNVIGNYPSRKMGVTIQFESHRGELAQIYELEYDPNVLEYYDQPPAIELIYLAKNGRHNRHTYTPDFFVIYKDAAGWEECKPEKKLAELAANSPNRYCKDDEDQWRCPPAEEYAAQYQLSFWIRSDAQIDWIFQRNFNWLEDYFRQDAFQVKHSIAQQICAFVAEHSGVTLLELLQQAEPDDIYKMIATQELYVNLRAAPLAEPDRVRVYPDQDTALAYERAVELSAPCLRHQNSTPLEVGITLIWDNEHWEIINTGTQTTALLRADGKFQELPNATLENLIYQGKITALAVTENKSREDEIQEILRCASPQEIAEANRRYEQIKPYLELEAPPTPNSTIRRWRIQYRQAEKIYGSGYVGLLPVHHAKGNRLAKIDEAARQFMNEFIENNYETLKHRRSWRVYANFIEACAAKEPKLTPPSSKTFYEAIKLRSGANQTEKREGRRAAIQKRPAYPELLTLTTPRHGDRPFEIVHIDHTQLDVTLHSSLDSLVQCKLSPDAKERDLGRPWATFAVDAYSRRLLAVYVTYEEPSYRSCMAVLSSCVQRFKRFPQSIVVDNGAEFHSHYFEQLLAYYGCTKKHRPPADARFGSVVERLFGTANTQFIHELRGNTQITRLPRQTTKSVRPEQQAIWTLGELNENLCHWAYEVYDVREHLTLGQSPRSEFNHGLAVGGSRLCRRVEYDNTFRMLMLPAPDRGGCRIVQPERGIKLSNIYYWSNDFRNPEVERSKVEVRYNPFDVSEAYAFVQGQWVKCISSYYQHFQGRSEKEINLISKELVKRKSAQGRNVALKDKDLAQFLNSVEAREGELLKQRLKALENMKVLQEASLLETVQLPTGEPELSMHSDRNPTDFEGNAAATQDEQFSDFDASAEEFEWYPEF